MASSLIVSNVTKSFKNKVVLNNLSFEAKEGEFVVLVGPSGCGKTTMLRCIAGLEQVDQGSIKLGNKDITYLPPKDRNIAMVFQDYALYPHKNVYENIAFGLRLRKYSQKEIDKRVQEAAKKLDLLDYLKRKPSQLSGGQRQRVAIGRAIVRNPEVFLFDEPLSNLDAKLRSTMRLSLAKLQKELQTTVIYVTHDQVEAMTLADKIIVLNDGSIQQIGTPLELYYHPKKLFVGHFIGSPEMNIIEGMIFKKSSNKVEFVSNKGFKITFPKHLSEKIKVPFQESLEVYWGIRPENFRIPRSSEYDDIPRLELFVEVTEPLGPSTLALCVLGGHEVRISIPEPHRPKRGETITLDWRSRHLYLFDKKTQKSVVDI